MHTSRKPRKVSNKEHQEFTTANQDPGAGDCIPLETPSQGRSVIRTSRVYSSKSRSWSWILLTSRNFQPRKVSNKYIRSLQQQIKVLELEIAYLKKLPAKEGL